MFPLTSTNGNYDDVKLGGEISCRGKSARFVKIEKTDPDPGSDSFDLCSLAVFGSCDCLSADIYFRKAAYKEIEDVNIAKGEKHVIHVHGPDYKTSDALLSQACPTRVSSVCKFKLGIRYSVYKGTKKANFVQLI